MVLVRNKKTYPSIIFKYPFLSRLDEVQEELLYYRWCRRSSFYVKVFLCNGLGAVRQAILSL